MRADDATAPCAGCGATAFREATETVSIALPRSGVTASVDAVPARRCAACDRVQVAPGTMARVQLAVACELANQGVRTGEVVRHMRKALGLRAADLAHLLDVTPETISHWETGKAPPNRAVFVALGAMVQEALDGATTTRDRLTACSKGQPCPAALAVKLR